MSPAASTQSFRYIGNYCYCPFNIEICKIFISHNNLLLEGRSFCFETVFSHPSKVDFVGKAKALGYQVILVMIHLESTSLNKARVAQRVEEGGHDVPAEKVETRIPRLLRLIKSVIPLCDHVTLR